MLLRSLELPDDYAAFLDARFGGEERTLAGRVRRLSDAYVAGRPPGRLGDEDRRAYAAYFGPVGALKVAAVLEELGARGWLPPADSIRFGDLGAGPGTATLGAALALRGRRIDARLVDEDPGWDASLLLRPFLDAGAVGIEVVRRPLWEARGPFDLVVAANVLVELDLPPEELAHRLDVLLARELAPAGALVVVEPATRSATRRLHVVRDALVARGRRVLAPCLHQEPCPMLRSASDWCHEARGWRPPRHVRRLDDLAGLDKRFLPFSYVAIGTATLGPAPPEGAARVVSSILREKGRTRFRTCDAAGRLLEWDLLRRVRGPLAERVDALERGDEVVLPHARGGRLAPPDRLDPLREDE